MYLVKNIVLCDFVLHFLSTMYNMLLSLKFDFKKWDIISVLQLTLIILQYCF